MQLLADLANFEKRKLANFENGTSLEIMITFPLLSSNGRVEMAQSSKVIPFRSRKRAAPIPLNGKVPPPRRKNSEVRSREHLTPDEIDRLIASAKSLGRYGHRDATLILVAYRHGLRVSELVAIFACQIQSESRTRCQMGEGVVCNAPTLATKKILATKKRKKSGMDFPS